MGRVRSFPFRRRTVPVYDLVMVELRAGQKTTHWMWFIFPQLDGLGHSEMAHKFAISGVEEAKAYLRHSLLGARLESCVSAFLNHSEKTAHQMFGSPDDLKLRSSLTLFAQASPGSPVFKAALDQFFDGEPDEKTLMLLQRAPAGPVKSDTT